MNISCYTFRKSATLFKLNLFYIQKVSLAFLSDATLWAGTELSFILGFADKNGTGFSCRKYFSQKNELGNQEASNAKRVHCKVREVIRFLSVKG